MNKSRIIIGALFQKNQSPTVIIKVIIFIILLLFSPLIIEKYTELIITPILSKFVTNTFFEFVIFASTIMLAIILIYKSVKSYNGLLNTQTFNAISILVVAYWIIRLDRNKFIYYKFSLFDELYITDWIISMLTIIMVIAIILFCFRVLKTEKIDTIEITDKLSREPYAISIADQIIQNKRNSNSYAIGITGCWGDGKTVFMEFIKKELKNNNDCIVLDFNPWYCSNPKTLVHDFFSSLQNELLIYNPNIKNSFKTYAHLLTKFYDKNNSLETLLDVFSVSSETLKDKFEEIRLAIKKIDKQIVICIDDLDRLDKEEIVETIRLIRNTANFDNTIFLVTYDKKYVVSALKSINDYATETYLEKIFQQEITLPAYNESYLRNELYEKMYDKIGPSVDKWFDQITREFSYRQNFSFFFKNLRSVSQFVNSYYHPFNLIKSDVNESDFFFLFLLCYKFPEAHRLIKTDIFQLNFNSSSYFERTKLHEQYNVIALKSADKESGLNTKNELRIENILFTEYSSEDAKIILSLLKMLFPYSNINSHVRNNEPDNYKRIYYTYNFQKYFSFIISDKNIPDEELNEAFTNNEYELENKIKYWVRNSKYESLFSYFEQRLNSIRTKEEYEKIIKSIIFFANQPSPQEATKDMSFNFMLFRENIISNKVRNFYKIDIEYKKHIISLFEKPFYPALFSARFLAEEIKNGKSYGELGKFPLNDNEMIEINIQHLKGYLEHSNELYVQAFWLYHCCDNLRKEKNRIAGQLIIDFAKKKDLRNFLKFMINHARGDSNQYNLSDLVFQLFGAEDQTGFKTFLDEVKEETPYYNEFMDFYQKYAEKDYTTVEFDFVHLNVNRWQVY